MVHGGFSLEPGGKTLLPSFAFVFPCIYYKAGVIAGNCGYCLFFGTSATGRKSICSFLVRALEDISLGYK